MPERKVAHGNPAWVAVQNEPLTPASRFRGVALLAHVKAGADVRALVDELARRCADMTDVEFARADYLGEIDPECNLVMTWEPGRIREV